MLKVRLNKSDYAFQAGHLLYNVSNKDYMVLAQSSRAGIKIIDDIGKEVWLSNTILRRYFSKIK